MGYADEQRAQARARQIRQQQQVQRALQQGRAITGYSANPLEATVQRIGSFFGIATPPSITNDPSGSERLMVAGGWGSQRSALPGTLNVAGRTWSLSPQTRSEGANAFYTPMGATTRTNTIASTIAPPQSGRTTPPPPSVGTGGSPAAERAYQAEASRVAQMAAQNPDLQRYEAARGAAKTQEEMNAVRDEGMRIWAAKHGGLAAKVKPGSTGYEAIQGVVGSSAPSALSSEQVQGLMSFDPNTVLNTTQEVQKQFRPNQELKDQEILNAMSFDPNTAMRSAAGMAFAPMSSTLSSEQVQGLMSFDPNTVLSTTQKVQKQFRPNQELKDQEILNAMSFDPNTAMRSAAGMAFAPGLPSVTGQEASRKLFEELLKRAAQNK